MIASLAGMQNGYSPKWFYIKRVYFFFRMWQSYTSHGLPYQSLNGSLLIDQKTLLTRWSQSPAQNIWQIKDSIFSGKQCNASFPWQKENDKKTRSSWTKAGMPGFLGGIN